MNTELTTHLDTPLGTITLTASEHGLTHCLINHSGQSDTAEPGEDKETAERARHWLDRAGRELTEYFAGDRTEFTVPVDHGTTSEFGRAVATALAEHVPYGSTVSYGQLTKLLDRPPVDARKVGAALGRNQLLIVVPCHRVLGADGSLTGFAAGLPAKRHLLDLESSDNLLPL
ncbi:MAG TPA: methylated-DNA--[protein]-cysteine S-methyltransferase [Pseudonocardiaceae bacterium]|jgi:methylated-DNA-[protein]-cysteine S-methyltransferase|nr:methylated-DNA--[protein]-cysteine S-methyltransferase [Pseudonocardiaceae bacterium]